MQGVLKKFNSNLCKKVFSCPQCQKNLRVPIMLGKTLRVTCPQCSYQIDVSFKNPFEGLFKKLLGLSSITKAFIFLWILVTIYFFDLVPGFSTRENLSQKNYPDLPPAEVTENPYYSH